MQLNRCRTLGTEIDSRINGSYRQEKPPSAAEAEFLLPSSLSKQIQTFVQYIRILFVSLERLLQCDRI